MWEKRPVCEKVSHTVQRHQTELQMGTNRNNGDRGKREKQDQRHANILSPNTKLNNETKKKQEERTRDTDLLLSLRLSLTPTLLSPTDLY
jgi:hypothetical protein